MLFELRICNKLTSNLWLSYRVYIPSAFLSLLSLSIWNDFCIFSCPWIVLSWSLHATNTVKEQLPCCFNVWCKYSSRPFSRSYDWHVPTVGFGPRHTNVISSTLVQPQIHPGYKISPRISVFKNSRFLYDLMISERFMTMISLQLSSRGKFKPSLVK